MLLRIKHAFTAHLAPAASLADNIPVRTHSTTGACQHQCVLCVMFTAFSRSAASWGADSYMPNRSRRAESAAGVELAASVSGTCASMPAYLMVLYTLLHRSCSSSSSSSRNSISSSSSSSSNSSSCSSSIKSRGSNPRSTASVDLRNLKCVQTATRQMQKLPLPPPLLLLIYRLICIKERTRSAPTSTPDYRVACIVILCRSAAGIILSTSPFLAASAPPLPPPILSSVRA